MKFIIKHDIRGRLRIHMVQSRMSYEEADTLLYYIENLSGVTSAKVFERTCDASISYKGDRETLLQALRIFQYQTTDVPADLLAHSGRELNSTYQEKLVQKVVLRAGSKLFLPYPIRAAYAAFKSLHYIWKGLRCLAGRKLEVEVLDATAIGVSVLRADFDTASSIMFLLGIGELLEEWTHKKSVDDLARSMSLNVSKVWLKKDDQEILVSSKDIKPGDEVIVPAPYWVSYYEMVRLFGGVPVVVNVSEEQGFQLTPEQLEHAITDKTKAIILNNPSNPTGAVYPKEALKAVADVCVKHDLYIISDEIYDKLVYDGVPFTSVAALSDEIKAHTILINGVSKTYAMTGWRIGYSLSPALVAKAMTNYLSHSTGAPGTMCQCAAIEALSGPQDEAEQMRKVFEQRRDLIVRRINAMPGVSCLKPSGAFYVMMNLEQILGKQIDGQVIGSGDDFAKLLLEKSLVAVVPGSGFGAPNFVRLSYAISTENIETGMDRLEGFLKQLQ